MFVLALLADTIRIAPPLLAKPTLLSVQSEIERRYPNKIIIDVGLVICPYGPPLEIGDGMLVPGDGGAHHQVLFQVLVFRPQIDEILVGIVTQSSEGGIGVSVGGFFDHVFIPAYWMLNPSTFDDISRLWVWTPTYDDDNDNDDDEREEEEEEEDKNKSVEKEAESGESIGNGKSKQRFNEEEEEEEEDGDIDQNRFEIEIGAEIRFKVKAVNFTRVTTTMKGVQATTTTTASHNTTTATMTSEHSNNLDNENYGDRSNANGSTAPSSHQITNNNNTATGNRGTSDHDNEDNNERNSTQRHPAPMQILGSICEDGLGLTSWWEAAIAGEDKNEVD